MALVNAYIVYGKLTQNKSSHLNFLVIVAKNLIGNYNNQRRKPQASRITKRDSGNFPTETPFQLPELEPSYGICHYCKNQGKENKKFAKCSTCRVFLWIVVSASGRSCYYKHHLQA